jgi:hypothetical protein
MEVLPVAPEGHEHSAIFKSIFLTYLAALDRAFDRANECGAAPSPSPRLRGEGAFRRMRGRPRIHKGCTAQIGGSDPELMPVAMEYRWQPDDVEEVRAPPGNSVKSAASCGLKTPAFGPDALRSAGDGKRLLISSFTLVEIAADQKKRDPSQDKQIEKSEVLYDRGHSAPPTHKASEHNFRIFGRKFAE